MDRKDTSNNIPLRIGSKAELWEKIMKEVKHQHFAGPFEEIPFENYVQSLVGLVPKADNQTRMIFHLSYRFKNGNESINYWTLADKCSVKYNNTNQAVRDCLKLIEEMTSLNLNGVLFYSKADLKSAFHMAPMKWKHWFLLISKAEDPETKGKWWYFVDKCMPFGASISWAHFQKISDALKHIVEVLESSFNHITNYLDDFLFIHYIKMLCNQLMERFLWICEQIKFLVSLEKCEWASTTVIFLGILLNGVNYTLLIPEDKVFHVINLIDCICDKKKATVKELQVLTGTLNFLHKAVVAGRVFMRQMYSKFSEVILEKNLKQHHHISLDCEFRNDCTVWKEFLLHQQAVSRPFIDLNATRCADDLRFYTDASKAKNLGFGCYFQGQWAF